ncbi:A/G-specific adenine glycosylase [Cellulophaga sp. L1A9]|uniref:A/G-specific adenine glycosylase n=1 Tax=Cellulophaga sp. L1A9 TaxID=2686362 RepID=UPI00131C9495|nr:A/G-specific adenine glycosylase [Cellulophaga sp. L1A9]
MTFSAKILRWYDANKRDLPWRNTVNPYNIWLSEIMLQQTRVAQGTPYYLKFIENFPTVKDLAVANEEEILKLWQGLGYYSRARNLHAAAKMVVNDFQGEFPSTYKELLQLKGVGDYTASAIASISFNLPEPVVDGNVYRVLARYFGISTPINSTEGIKYFKKIAREVMNTKNIRNYNQGIMEFGAIQCAPRNPNCSSCPLNDSCVALRDNKVQVLPVKIKKGSVKHRFFNYLVVVDTKRQSILKQRTGKGIWQNLYEFPLIESEIDPDVLVIEEELKKYAILNQKFEYYKFNEDVIVHKLSHQHLKTHFWIVTLEGEIPNGVAHTEIDKFPVPVLVADFIKTFKF